MKRIASVVLVLALMPAMVQAEDKKTGELIDPVDILKKVDAACKAVKTVKYDVVVEGLGDAAARVGKIEGTVILSGLAYNAPEKTFVDLKVTRADQPEPQRITSGSDGDMFYVVDHAAKKAYEDIDPQVIGSFGRTIQGAYMIEFVHATPFEHEIQGAKKELRGSEVVGGEDCYKLYVEYAQQNAPAALWSFSKKDFLPRRRIDTYPNGVSVQKTITNLKADPKLPDEAFTLKLPEGYTKTDDFAP